jgi:hypothetical protein
VKDVFSEVRRYTVRAELSAGIISLRIKRRSGEVGEMSIFPTKNLLATSGSEAAELALHTAVAFLFVAVIVYLGWGFEALTTMVEEWI